MVVTLTTIALALIASEQTRGTGLLLLVPAAVFLLWATISFYRRSYALSQKTMPALEDATVPVVPVSLSPLHATPSHPVQSHRTPMPPPLLPFPSLSQRTNPLHGPP